MGPSFFPEKSAPLVDNFSGFSLGGARVSEYISSVIISTLLYQRCVEGGRYNWQKLKGIKTIWDQAIPLDAESARASRWAKKAIGAFRKEAQGGPMDIRILPMDCVNRCASGHMLYRLGLRRNPFILLAFSEGSFLLADLRSAQCSNQAALKSIIYGFDGVLIWDLYENAEQQSLALVYRRKSVLTGGGASAPQD